MFTHAISSYYWADNKEVPFQNEEHNHMAYLYKIIRLNKLTKYHADIAYII